MTQFCHHVSLITHSCTLYRSPNHRNSPPWLRRMNWCRGPSLPSRRSATTTWPRPWSPSPRLALNSPMRSCLVITFTWILFNILLLRRGTCSQLPIRMWWEQGEAHGGWVLVAFCLDFLLMNWSLGAQIHFLQVISSIEQKTEGSEKKQQLAKEYREKVSRCWKFLGWLKRIRVKVWREKYPNKGLARASIRLRKRTRVKLSMSIEYRV